MAKSRKSSGTTKVSQEGPTARLLGLIDTAVELAKTARKHHQSLSGMNFYANKLATTRADGTNAYRDLASRSVGDTSALAELMETVFSTSAKPKDRVQAARDLKFALMTTWVGASVDTSHLEEEGIFPLVTLSQTKRGYMVAIGRQMNGCYTSGWYDACAVMMRRLLEAAIMEAFEARAIDTKIKDAKGEFFQLSALVSAALNEGSWNLSRNVKKELPNLRDLGHKSAHGRHYLAKKMYVDELKTAFRDALEAFLHEARLI